MFIVHHDAETFSPADIKSAGSYAYLQHPETELLCLAYWLKGRPVEVFRVGLDDDPVPFLNAVENGEPLGCWNSGFEWAMWQYLIPKQFPHWPVPRLEQFHDVMAWSLAAALPGSLERAAPALGLEEIKDKTGKRVMLKLSRPRKPTKTNPATRWTRENAAADFDVLYEYCKQDVRTEKAIAGHLRPLPPTERTLWLVDQRINDRGIGLDMPAIRAANAICDLEQARLDALMVEATDGAVTATTQTKALANWLGVDSVAKDTVRDLLADDDLEPAARWALEIRKEAGKSSVKKYPAMLARAGSTDSAQGSFQYHRATTGRWGGLGVQPQNMPRPKLSAGEVAEVVELLGDFSPADARTMIELGYGAPLDVLSWCLRGMFVARPGYAYVGGDYSNIEGRVLAWLAGEHWKLDAFRAYDAGHGADLYKLAYANSFGVSPDTVTDEQRQIGKVQELQLGYQGGVGAFVSSQKQGAWSFEEIAEAVAAAADPGQWAAAERKRQWLQVDKHMHAWLPPKVYTALRYLTDTWRDSNSNIRNFWADLENCALNAVRYPGELNPTKNGLLAFSCGKNFLYCKLPSGRVLSYARPGIELVWNDIAERDEGRVAYWATGKDKDRPTHFGKHEAYGGLWAENVTQAVARDILAAAIIRLEKADFPVVLHVHDEARCEVSGAHCLDDTVQEIMTEVPSWARGLPVAAECETMTRYHK